MQSIWTKPHCYLAKDRAFFLLNDVQICMFFRHLSLREDTPDSQLDTNGVDQDLQEPLWLQDLGDLPSFPEKRISAPGAMKDRHRSGGGNLGEGMAHIYKQQKSSNDIVRQNLQVVVTGL